MIEYYAGQFAEVAGVFHSAVHRTAAAAYSPEQLAAWSPDPPDLSQWRVRCEMKRPWVATLDGRVAGFLELDHWSIDGQSEGHIDCHYVHADFGRRGVGTALLRHAISVASEFGLSRLVVEASHIAAPLYLREGFSKIDARPNVVQRLGVELENWKLERRL